MLHLSRFGLGLLLLNLTLFGQELACAHDSEARAQPASADHGGPPHHQDPAPEPAEEPCDETAAQCCDAIPSCSIAGLVGQPYSEYDTPLPTAAARTIAELHLVNAPLEVATPPPRH